jgi:XRE family transcriptional regulator, regulator of sulfur utilization
MTMARRTAEGGATLAPPRIGAEILRARREAGLSLDDLARRSGVSKSILSQIERDAANPTLATVWRVCGALETAPETLFGGGTVKPDAGIVSLAVHATPEIQSEDGRCRLRILGAIDTVERLQWYEFIAEPGGELLSAAHGPGTVEHLTVIEGKLTVTANEATRAAGPGETLRYETANGTHRVANEGAKRARAMMVCVL